jgi:hypothetical protein
MAMYWVSYRRDHLLAGAVIVEADSPCHAQTLASVRWSDWNLEFTEGTPLDGRQAAQLPANAKGHLLSLMAAHNLSVRFEQEQRRMRRHSAVQAQNAWARNSRDAA